MFANCTYVCWKRSTARQQEKHRLKVLSADYRHPVRRSKRTLNARQDKSVTVSINFPTAKQISRFSLNVLSLFIFYIYIISPFSALEQTHCALVACVSKWMTSFSWYGFEYPPKWCSADMAGACVPHKTAAVSARSVYTTHCVTSLHTKPHT